MDRMKAGDAVLWHDKFVHIVAYVDRPARTATPEMTLKCRPHFYWKVNVATITWDAPTCLFCVTGSEGPHP
jgi:hypothetical protein